MPFTNTIGSNTIQGYRDLGEGVNDPLFNDVILLLQPTGVDTQAFDDKSQYNFSSSINAVRGAIPLLETTDQKWSSDYKVINLNDTSSHIICADYIPNLIASSSSPDTWTVEMWFMLDSVPNVGQQFGLIMFNGNTFGGSGDNPHVDNYITFWAGNQQGNSASGQHFYAIIEENGSEVIHGDLATYTTGQYYHVAIVNNNKSVSVYIDGTRVLNRAITSTVRGSYGDNDRDSFQIGADQDGTTTNDYADIRIAGVRVTRNQARYGGTSFTVPNQPFSLRGTSTNILGGASGAPITSEVEGLRYLDHFNLGNTPALAWIQHPRVNGGNAYQAYILKDGGYLWVLAAKLASSGLNSQIYSGSAVTGTQSGFPSFTWQDFPASSTVNDWGVDTHTYNATAYDTTTTKSMRTRIWPELRSKYKRIYVADWNHADGGTQNPSGRILYIQNRGRYNENEIGVNQSWGEFMENPAASDAGGDGYGQNDNGADGTGARFGGLGYPGDTTHIWPNESDGSNALPVAGMKKYSNSWGFAGLDYLYLGATDREQTSANTNDAAMISGATTERIPSSIPANTNPAQLGTAGSGGMNSITGIGVKRARINNSGFAIEFGGSQASSTTPPKGNDINANDINQGGYHSNFCTLMANGRVEIENNARMNFWTRLQGGNGSTIDRAFDGSLMELDSLWYNNAIPNGVYWFKSSVLGIIAVDVVTRGGKKWIQIPFGTSSSSNGVTLTSAKISDKDSPAANFYVFNITIGGAVGTGAATVANLTFDSDNRLGNGDNDSTTTKGSVDHNANIGWGLWNIGIPFRQLQYNMSFKSHWATGGGGNNADWNDYQHETPFNPTAIQPQYAGQSGDWPFVMIPDPADPLNKMININGNTTYTSTYRTSGWTGAGDQGVQTRSMETTTTIEMGKVGSGARQDEHATEAYRFGVGFAAFGKETYRAESGYFYIR